jgi:hypothetical protein
MAVTIDRATLDRLIALGRERGEITAAELQAALPVDALDVDALVLVMLELEAAGVSVEPDALGPRAESDVAPRLVLASPEPTVPRATVPADGERRTGGNDRRPEQGPGVAATMDEDDPGVGRIVLGAGLAVFLILATILILL